MTNPISPPPNSSLDEKRIAQLRAELKAPYRGLRHFFYLGFAGSAWIGGMVFLMKLVAGEDPRTILPNLMLQIGVLALMVWLFKIDRPRDPS